MGWVGSGHLSIFEMSNEILRLGNSFYCIRGGTLHKVPLSETAPYSILNPSHKDPRLRTYYVSHLPDLRSLVGQRRLKILEDPHIAGPSPPDLRPPSKPREVENLEDPHSGTFPYTKCPDPRGLTLHTTPFQGYCV